MAIDKRPASGLDLAVMMLLELLAENKALREIAETVANTFAMNRFEECAYCEAQQATKHTPDCIVTKACVLLGTADERIVNDDETL